MIFVGLARALAYILATSPVWYVPWTLYPAVFGKVPIFLSVIGALAILVALRHRDEVGPPEEVRPRGGGRLFRALPLQSAVVAYVALYALSAFFGVDPWQSVWGQESRGSGLVILIALAVWFFLARRVFDDRSWRRFWWIVLVGALLEMLVVFIEAGSPRIAVSFGDLGRSSAFFGNPAYLGGYLAMAFFISIFLSARAKRSGRILLSASAVALFVAVFLTGTRSAALALAVGVFVALAVFIFLTAAPQRRRLLRTTVPFILLIAAILGVFFVQGSPVSGAVRRVFFEPLSVARLLHWGIAGKAFLARPVLGWGPEAFQHAFDRLYDPELLRVAFSETIADKPHNLALETLASGGVILFLAFIGLFIAAGYGLVAAGRRRRFQPLEIAGAWGMLAAYLAHTAFLFDTMPTSFLLFSLFSWIAGQTGVGVRIPAALVAPRAVRLLGVLLFAALALAAGPLAVPASGAAMRALRAETPDEWLPATESALRTPSVHKKEIAKQLARDFLFRETRGSLPEALIKDQAPVIRAALEDLVRTNPQDFTLWFFLGQLYTIEGGYLNSPEALNKAVEAFRQARDLSPRRQAVPFQLSKTLLLGDQAGPAIELLRGVVSEDPTLAEPHWFLGLALIASGDIAGGAQEISESLRLGRSPRNEEEALYIIGVLDQAERYDQVISIFKALINNNPNNPKWHARLAATYKKAGKPELAILEAQRAAELDPGYQAEADAFIANLK